MSMDKLLQNINHQSVRDMFRKDAFGALFLVDLGAPAVQNTAGIVADGNMKNGAYTLAGQPDVPRSLGITVTKETANDTMPELTITGTDYNDDDLVEKITPNNGDTSSGYKETVNAFKTVASIVGEGWVEATATDQIKIGLGKKLGLPLALKTKADMPIGFFDNAVQAHTPVVVDPPTVSGTTVDMSAGTYDEAKVAQVLVRFSA